jgi:hypothetical protein
MSTPPPPPQPSRQMVAPPPPPNFNDNSIARSPRQHPAQRLTPRQERQLRRLQKFIEPPPQPPIDVEVTTQLAGDGRDDSSRSFPVWFPFLLATLVFGLGIATIAAGTLAYYALRDPAFVKVERTQSSPIEFSRWTLVAIAATCTAGSILMARLHDGE